MTQVKREVLSFGAGCFWGVEHAFKQLEGVLSTEVGFQGGETKAPTYEQVCSLPTGHVEVVKVEFDPHILSFERIIKAFFFIHDPTQENRQGPDRGTQYRSAIFCFNEEQEQKVFPIISAYREAFLKENPGQKVTTTISVDTSFTPASEEHQNYLARNPSGYCHIGFDLFHQLKLGKF